MINFERIQRYGTARTTKILPWLLVGLSLTGLALVLSQKPTALLGLALFALAFNGGKSIARRLARGVYGLDQKADKEVDALLTYRWVGDRPLFNPYLLVKEGAVTMGSEVLREMGGPGGLVLYQDSAVVLEKHGKLARVIVGPKFPDLEPFERVWDVIDLRPQRWVFAVSAITADGIPIEYDADVQFQVEPNEEAVLKASLSTWIREAHRTEPDRLMTWTKRVIIGETEGALRTILSHYTLDDLLAADTRRQICAELQEKLEAFGKKLGVRILKTNLKDLKLEGKVIEQWFETWRAERVKVMQLEIMEGTKNRAQALEKARTEVRKQLLKKTLETLESLGAGQSFSAQLVILSCIEVIKRTAFDLNIFLPADLLKTLDTLRESARKPS